MTKWAVMEFRNTQAGEHMGRGFEENLNFYGENIWMREGSLQKRRRKDPWGGDCEWTST